MSTVDVEIIIQPKGRGKPRRDDRAVQAAGTPRVPRIARLMALAIKFQDMVDQREVRDCADLARLGYVTRARITQIMNLLNLAPDLQELLLTGPSESVPPERHLRCITRCVFWDEQRRVHGETSDSAIYCICKCSSGRVAPPSPAGLTADSRPTPLPVFREPSTL